MKILQVLQRFFHNTNVKKQLNFIYVSALLIPVLIIGIFLIVNTRRLLLNHYQEQVEADNTRVKSVMFDVTTTVYNISDEIFADKNLQTLLATRYSTRQEAAKSCSNFTKLSNYIYKNTFISSIELYTTNPTIFEYASFKPVTKDILSTPWYQEASKRADILWKSLNSVDSWNNTSQELCLIRRIPIIHTKEYAILVIRISNIYLKNRIQNNSLFTAITVNKDPVFYGSERNLSGNNLNLPIDYEQPLYQFSGQLTYENKERIANISTLHPYTSKDKIYISTLDFHALDDTANIIMVCSTIILIATIVPLVIITLFTNQFSSRIITLRGEMYKASKGNYNIIDSIPGDDELSQVFSDLKVMIQSITQMNAQMYEAKIQEQVLKNQQQKMEYKMLSSQINPHFLYNTLETIRMKSLTEGNRDVANAIKLLGKSMHYVLENTGTSSTTLKKELDYISTYLAIQKLRFNDRVNYTLTVPEDMDLEEYQILPLLLQPIVENAILHGLDETEYNGQICINVKTKDDELLLINIFDNGLGMTEEELNSLTDSIQTPRKTNASNIGLHNINQRIKLFYGDAYGVEIKSQPKEGTLVSLTLPLHNIMED
ncbi:sensor histidine kinase [Anaerocolumna sedimenticola]|uniref:Sensor histidine kinase n=1 Tax=Anaerocolumna sedimenticola TaxID=2696063 RepID=A0A6P1TPW4_9FIRM|nr:histidine kinase [Anaerocolumna sedimenticola]QHQ63024.1 sensor histidine kinase [Anaerocolumna sedimenticola]